LSVHAQDRQPTIERRVKLPSWGVVCFPFSERQVFYLIEATPSNCPGHLAALFGIAQSASRIGLLQTGGRCKNNSPGTGTDHENVAGAKRLGSAAACRRFPAPEFARAEASFPLGQSGGKLPRSKAHAAQAHIDNSSPMQPREPGRGTGDGAQQLDFLPFEPYNSGGVGPWAHELRCGFRGEQC